MKRTNFLCVLLAALLLACVAAVTATTLHEAAAAGDLEGISRCLDAGAAVDQADTTGATPLEYAITANSANAVALLLEKGANPDGRPDRNTTPLMLAVQNKALPIAQVLLQHGAKITVRDAQGRTALHWAANAGDAELGALLIQAGGNVNEPDNDGKTPLRLALDQRAYPLVSKMLPKLSNPAQLVELYHAGPATLDAEVKQCLLQSGVGAVPALVAALGRENPLSLISDTLVSIGKPAIPSLVTMWRSPTPGYRERAGAVLTQLQWSPTSIQDKCSWYYARKDWAKLRALGKDATPTLLWAMKNGDALERQKALGILVTQKDPRARLPLAAMLKRDDAFSLAVAKALYAAKWLPEDPAVRARWLVKLRHWQEAAKLGFPALGPLVEQTNAFEYEIYSNAGMAIDSLIEQAPNKQALLQQILKTGNLEYISETYRFIIQCGRKGTEQILIDALNAHGHSLMCEEYLNCGNRRLMKAANAWASTNNCRIMKTQYGNGGPMWGAGF